MKQTPTRRTIRNRQIYLKQVNRSVSGWKAPITMEEALLITDDDHNVLNSLKRELRKEDYPIFWASSGREGLDLLQRHDIAVVLSDQRMPHMDGVTFLEKVRHYKPEVIRMILTGYSSRESAIDAINRSGVFSYITKPWSSSELKSAISKAFQYYRLEAENRRLMALTQSQNLELKDLNTNLEKKVAQRTRLLQEAIEEGITMLAAAAEAKDDDTGDHIRRIQIMTRDICQGLGLDEQLTEDISFFSMMHDVGKIHIPDSILKKPGKLNPDEWIIMKTHTVAGETIMGNKDFYAIARQIARSHHERWDGTGYPDGLAGEQIPLPARIVTVADVFDALTNDRPYKKAWPVAAAIAEIKKLTGTAFDPEVVNVFLKFTGNLP